MPFWNELRVQGIVQELELKMDHNPGVKKVLMCVEFAPPCKMLELEMGLKSFKLFCLSQ